MDWKDLTLSQYYNVLDIIKTEDDPVDLNILLVNEIFGVDAANIPFMEFQHYLDKLDFLKESYKPKLPKTVYEIGGEKFRPFLEPKKITTAHYIDWLSLLKKKDYKHLLNCLFIKEGEAYGDSDNSELLWNNLTLDVYSDVLYFFQESLRLSTRDTLLSSLQMMRKSLKHLPKEERVPTLRRMVQLRRALLAVNGNG